MHILKVYNFYFMFRLYFALFTHSFSLYLCLSLPFYSHFDGSWRDKEIRSFLSVLFVLYLNSDFAIYFNCSVFSPCLLVSLSLSVDDSYRVYFKIECCELYVNECEWMEQSWQAFKLSSNSSKKPLWFTEMQISAKRTDSVFNVSDTEIEM